MSLKRADIFLPFPFSISAFLMSTFRSGIGVRHRLQMSSLAIIQICSLAIGIYHRWDGIAAETSILDIAVLCSVRTWFEDNINLLILHGGKSFNFFSSPILVSMCIRCAAAVIPKF